MTTHLCKLLEGHEQAEARKAFQSQVARNQGVELMEPLTVFGLNKTILVDDDLPTLIDDICSFGAEGRAKTRFMKRETESAVRTCRLCICSCVLHYTCTYFHARLPACHCIKTPYPKAGRFVISWPYTARLSYGACLRLYC